MTLKEALVAVAVSAMILTFAGNRLLKSPIFEKASLNLSPHNFTQCASSTTRAYKLSLYVGVSNIFLNLGLLMIHSGVMNTSW